MQLELGVDESYTIYIAAAGGANSIVRGATIEVVFLLFHQIRTFGVILLKRFERISAKAAPSSLNYFLLVSRCGAALLQMQQHNPRTQFLFG